MDSEEKKEEERTDKGEKLKFLLDRIAFLYKTLPKIEKACNIFLKQVVEGKEKDIPAREVFQYYVQLTKYHTQALDIIKRVMIYFPVDLTSRERDLLLQFRGLSEDSKKLTELFVKGRLKVEGRYNREQPK